MADAITAQSDEAITPWINKQGSKSNYDQNVRTV
jgi:hypothetical protein